MKKKVNDIVVRDDLYPRMEMDIKKVGEYAENIELLPPILINQDNILIDGKHRLFAHKKCELDEIEVIIEKTKSDDDIRLRAIETNATHGLQLSSTDKKSLAIRLYDLKNRQRLIKALSVSESAFDKWVANKASQLKEQQEKAIIDLYLHAEYTQQEIADKTGVTQPNIAQIIKNCKGTVNYNFSDFEPFLYNIWNVPKISNEQKHFGNFPIEFMENLLYYYTEPFDVVYDPFAGGGVTIDACKKWYRRFYVSDMNPAVEREGDVHNWKIQDGLSDDLPSPDFVFLDPPYWKQAEGKYSKDKNDLGNMELEDFYNTLSIFIKALKNKMKAGRIALVIQPTQWKNKNKEFEDHIIKLIALIEKSGFKEEMRYVLPYSTQQYNPQQVEVAKKEKFCLNIVRDLVIFKKENGKNNVSH